MSDNIIVSMFQWWNDAIRDPNGFTPEAFARFYTEDAQLIVNSNLRGTGHEALAAHFQRVQEIAPTAQMVLPVAEEFTTPDRAFVHVFERVEDEAGKEMRRECMAYAVVEGGRMKLLRVIGID